MKRTRISVLYAHYNEESIRHGETFSLHENNAIFDEEDEVYTINVHQDKNVFLIYLYAFELCGNVSETFLARKSTFQESYRFSMKQYFRMNREFPFRYDYYEVPTRPPIDMKNYKSAIVPKCKVEDLNFIIIYPPEECGLSEAKAFSMNNNADW